MVYSTLQNLLVESCYVCRESCLLFLFYHRQVGLTKVYLEYKLRLVISFLLLTREMIMEKPIDRILVRNGRVVYCEFWIKKWFGKMNFVSIELNPETETYTIISEMHYSYTDGINILLVTRPLSFPDICTCFRENFGAAIGRYNRFPPSLFNPDNGEVDILRLFKNWPNCAITVSDTPESLENCAKKPVSYT